MRKLKILTVAVMTLTLTFTSTVQSNAAPCSAKDGKNLTNLLVEYMVAKNVGDLDPLFAAIDKAIKGTKSKKLKAVLTKLETAVEEDGEVNDFGLPYKLFNQAMSLSEYKRC